MDRAAFTRNTLRDFVSHFSLRITHDNVISRREKRIGDLPFGCKGFAAARRTQNQAVGVFQPLAVHHDKVVRQGIQAIVESTFAALEQFLGRKGNKNCGGTGGQRPFDLDEILRQRQTGHKSLFLLVIQTDQLTVMLLCNTRCLENIVFQFLFGFTGIEYQKGQKEHPFVLTLQLLQEGFCIPAISGQIRRK